MRIKVVTSINVRSSPFASPRVVTQEALRMDRFIASQRIPRGSRLSGWLHGTSIRDNDGRSPTRAMKTSGRRRPTHAKKTSHTSTYCFATAEGGSQNHAPGIRSYPSTRGVIDPVHSPTTVPTQLTYGSDHRHDAYLARLRAELGSRPREHGTKSSHSHRQRSKRTPAKNNRLCFPQIKDTKMRQKIFGCLFFGTLLTVILTTCKSHLPTTLVPITHATHTLKHLLMPSRPRPRRIRIPTRHHLPRPLHLLHPRPHHPIQPLPDPPLHASLRTPNPLRAQIPLTAAHCRSGNGIRTAQTTNPRCAGER